MKITCVLPLFLALTLSVAVAAPASPASKSAKKKSAALATAPAPAPGVTPTPVAPATPVPASSLTLDAYVQALSDEMTLSKDEKTDIKTYYLDDGSKLNQILNDGSLSPLQQTQQVDDLRNIRNAKIEALLRDVERQEAFRKTEAGYRVALTELVANGGFVPATPLPNVPAPTATPPSQAEKTEKPGSPPQASGVKKD